jgi:hypothetical protein
LRVLGDFVIEIVHQHPDGGFGRPMLRLDLAASAGANVAAIVASIGQFSTPP